MVRVNTQRTATEEKKIRKYQRVLQFKKVRRAPKFLEREEEQLKEDE